MDSTTSEGQSQEVLIPKKTSWLWRRVFGATIGGWLTLVIVAIIAFSHVILTWEDYGSIDIDDAVTFFTVCAQMNATVAGFLLVGLLFIIGRRSFAFGPGRWYIQHIDIALFGFAVVILLVNAFGCLSNMLYAMGQNEIDQQIVGDVSVAIFASELSYILIILGLLFTMAISKVGADTNKAQSEGRESTDEPGET